MAKNRKRPRSSTKQAKVEEYLLANPKATVQQTILACGVSKGTVTTARRSLREQGLIDVAPWDFASKEAKALLSESAAKNMEEAEERARQVLSATLEPSEIRARLVDLINRARLADDDKTELAGIDALRKHDASSRDASRLGPGDPLREEGRIDRLYLLLEAATPILTYKAALKAFTEAEIRDLARLLTENAHRGRPTDTAGIEERDVNAMIGENSA